MMSAAIPGVAPEKFLALSRVARRAGSNATSSRARTRGRSKERPALTSITAAGDSAAQTNPARRSARMQSAHRNVGQAAHEGARTARTAPPMRPPFPQAFSANQGIRGTLPKQNENTGHGAFASPNPRAERSGRHPTP